MDNKNILAENLSRYMKLNSKSRKEVCDDLGLNYYTFTDWINGRKYPRMDKVEILANYFGILKSDLIEEKVEKEPQNEVPVALSAPQGYDNLTDEQKELIQSLIDKYNEKNIGNK